MRSVVSTPHAPKAIGPYSQGIKANGFVFTAGQAGLDPATGKLAGEDIVSQTQQVMRNLQAILEEAGSSMDKVVKTTVFVVDLADFKTVNEIYGSFFTGEPPARSTVQVAALPLGALVEIEAVALEA
ncbi:MAG: RidA family protein [Anaerolineae bacterium]|nr:RidA family protein [Anaerolineae bacterium]